jgi:cobaltochelatase CobS
MWAQDESNGRKVLVELGDYTRGDAVPEDKRHYPVCQGKADNAPQDAANALNALRDRMAEQDAPVNGPEVDAEPVSPAPRVETPAAPPAAAPGSLDAIIHGMVANAIREGAAVDSAQVEAIVKSQLNDIVFPSTHTHERANGDVIKVEGAHAMLPRVIKRLNRGRNVMVVGPAGTGKSTLAMSAAEALGLPFYSLSMGPVPMDSKIMGYKDANGVYHGTDARTAFEFGGVLLVDEIDTAHAGALKLANALFENKVVGFPDRQVERHPDFRVVAAANTYGRGRDRVYVGGAQLDASTLDRFSVLTVDVDEALESRLCMATGLDQDRVISTLAYIRGLRKRSYDEKMTAVISPRGSVGMCALLADDEPWADALESEFLKGMSEGDRRKLGV